MYTELDDKDLVKLAQQGDNNAIEYIITKYQSTIIYMSKPYRKCGVDLDDLIQEGRIAVYNAIVKYVDKGCLFKTFMMVCVRRRFLSAISTHLRGKHRPLNQAVPMEYEDVEGIVYGVYVADNGGRPEDIFETRELIQTACNDIEDRLTDREARVLKMRMVGYRYKEIARMENTDENDIKKILTRGRRKMRRIKGRYNGC